MKTCFISRFGGFGDIVHCSHLPRLIKEYYKVDRIDFETSYQGYQILQNNPYIDNLVYVDASKLTQNRMVKNWKHCEENYDLFFNFVYTIERAYCCLETDNHYYRSTKFRREKLGKMNYYDVMTEAAGLPEEYFGTRGELYYSEEEHKKAQEWIRKKKENHNADWCILVCLSGSSLHKRFQQAESVCRKILDKYKHAIIILTGNKDCEPQLFTHNRVFPKVDRWNFRSVALMAKYFDFVISPETGLVCVAHLWDTPTLQLLSAASWENHIKYAKNAYWVQSPVECSPCHKGPHHYYGCPRIDDLPACVFYNEEEILKKVDEAYEQYTNDSQANRLVPAEVSNLR
jgi:ADP-heptose:LPS heptosyltransferase